MPQQAHQQQSGQGISAGGSNRLEQKHEDCSQAQYQGLALAAALEWSAGLADLTITPSCCSVHGAIQCSFAITMISWIFVLLGFV